MRLALLLVAVAACGGGAKTLRLPSYAEGVDSTTVFDQVITNRYEVHQESGTLTTTTVDHERSHRKVIAVEGALVIKVAVRFEVDEAVTTEDSGAQTTTTGPLAGKAYVIWRDRDALEAEHADGSPILAEERADLNGKFRSLGKTSHTDALVTGQVWKPNESVPIDDELVHELGVPENADVREATWTWTGNAGPVSTFRAMLTYTTADRWDVQLTADGRFDRASGRGLGSRITAIARSKVGPYDVVQSTEAVLISEVE